MRPIILIVIALTAIVSSTRGAVISDYDCGIPWNEVEDFSNAVHIMAMDLTTRLQATLAWSPIGPSIRDA